MKLKSQMGSDYQVLNVKEISEILQVHQSTIYRLIKEGKIPSFRVASEWRFRTDEKALDDWTAASMNRAPTQTFEIGPHFP
jgi:excisionase family DNA binding protein